MVVTSDFKICAHHVSNFDICSRQTQGYRYKISGGNVLYKQAKDVSNK